MVRAQADAENHGRIDHHCRLPTGFVIVSGIIVLILAVRFRGSMSIAFATLCLLGTWNAGDAQPIVAALMGVALYGVLALIANVLAGRGELYSDAPASGYDYAAE